MQEPCLVRRALGHAVAVAIAKTYAAREAHETELRAKVPNVGALRALSIGLADARKAESDAVRAMQAHIDQHGCRA